MKIAIVGAGFFGLTLGLILSKKHKVEIFEKKKSIMHGASCANQFRFHLGYHYPRSQKTVKEINKSKDLFISYFGSNIFGKTSNYYLVAKESKVKFNKYKRFLKKNNLPKLYATGSYYYLLIKVFKLKDMNLKLFLIYLRFYFFLPFNLIRKIIKIFF